MLGMWEQLAALTARLAAGEAAAPAALPAAAFSPAASPLVTGISPYISPVIENPSVRALTYTTPGVVRFQEMFPLAVPKEVPPCTVTIPACLLTVEVRGCMSCACVFGTCTLADSVARSQTVPAAAGSAARVYVSPSLSCLASPALAPPSLSLEVRASCRTESVHSQRNPFVCPVIGARYLTAGGAAAPRRVIAIDFDISGSDIEYVPGALLFQLHAVVCARACAWCHGSAQVTHWACHVRTKRTWWTCSSRGCSLAWTTMC
jgi:hypothetical protein